MHVIHGYVCGGTHMHVYVGSMGFDVVKEEKRHMILRLEDINDKKMWCSRYFVQ